MWGRYILLTHLLHWMGGVLAHELNRDGNGSGLAEHDLLLVCFGKPKPTRPMLIIIYKGIYRKKFIIFKSGRNG